MSQKIKISQLPAKGANLGADDLLEIAEFTGTGYVSKSITGQEIIDAASGSGTAWGSITGTLSSQTDLQTALDAKQDDLVSGTNIKTINGNSVLGSGDLIISSGVTDVTATSPIVSTGGATPDISISQSGAATDGYLSTGDWNAFNNKQDALSSGVNIKTINSTSVLGSGNIAVQPTLVSGTNIKTINGSSVLGSGDLTISGGLQGVHNVNGYFDLTSQGISAQLNAAGTSTVIMAANQMYAYPFIPNKTITSVSLKINVTVSGAGVNCRVLIYSSVNGAPTTKIYESADLDCSTTGIKTATTAQTFTAGTTYWLCVQSSGTTTLSGIQALALLPLTMSSTLSATPTVAYINTSIFGSAPTTFVINNRTNSTVPLLGIYLS
jgi:hypothetical protein